MIAQELMEKLKRIPDNTPVVFEFGTYEGMVTDAEFYDGAHTDGQAVLVIFCQNEDEE